MDELLPSLAARALELVGAHVDRSLGVAVVGVLEHDDVLAARERAREPQGQLVGLAAGVDEERDLQGLGQERGEPLRVAHDVLVEVARVGVEQRDLLLRGPHDAGVGVSHQRHVVVAVEVGATGIVVQVLAPSPDDLERTAIGEAQVGAEAGAARRAEWLGAALCGREALIGDAEKEVGIGRERLPQRPAPRRGPRRGSRRPRPSRSRMIWKWTCGGQSPFAGGAPTRAKASPRARRWPTESEAQRVFAQVPVEREEGRLVSGLVAQDHERPVVLAGGVVRQDVHHTVEGRPHDGARWREQVHSEVDGAALVGRARAAVEERRVVERPGLVVASDADGRARTLHGAEDRGGQGARRRRPRDRRPGRGCRPRGRRPGPAPKVGLEDLRRSRARPRAATRPARAPPGTGSKPQAARKA